MSPETDLFGNEITAPEPVVNAQKRRKTMPKGYAAPPGTGPKGETCGTCEHYCRVHGGKYRKCGKVRERWTHGPGTDILARSAACAYWERAK